MKRSVIGVVFVLIGAFCSALSVFTAMDMHAMWGNTAACSIDSLSLVDLDRLSLPYTDLKWTAYAQTAPQKVEHAQMSLRVDVVPVLIYVGDVHRIAFFPLVSGRLPMDGEQGVCVMDEGTAYRLFGSSDPINASVRTDGKLLRVVGVTGIGSTLLLMPANATQKLDRLVCDDRDALALLTAVIGVEADPFELSCDEMVRLLWLLCAVPWLIAAVVMLCRQHRGDDVGRILITVLLLMLCLGTVMLAIFCLPVRLLPSRWSDLSFYGKLIAEYSARMFRASDIRDELLKWGMLRTRLLCASACIAEGIGMIISRPN